MGNAFSGLVRKSKLASRLSLSTSSFYKLREAGRIYVDKTALIYTLACRQEKFFLTRPRRFGKSLLVSTLESLFGEGLKDFKGLAIESLWNDKTYAVVRVDFLGTKNFETFEEFRETLHDRLELAFAPYGFVYDAASRLKFYSQLSAWLRAQPRVSLVLLIDEYDAPLCACLGDPELFKRVRKELSSFYAEVKSNDAAFRFVFMTGITKFSQTGIFSELNDFTDISLNPEYGVLLGYTREELKANFGMFLVEAQKKLGLSETALLDAMACHYDGYCFDCQVATHVFNPWSVMNFLQAPEAGFCNYWIRTGGLMTALLEYLKTHVLKNPAQFEEGKVISEAVLSAAANENTISDMALLTQAGYLTIKKFQGGNFHLGYPNEEVATSMASLYSELLLNGRLLDDVGAGDVANVLARGTIDEVVAEFNKVLGALDYVRYPVTDEAVCRAFLQVFLCGAKLYALMEVHNAFGRSDLEVEAGGRYWVFELKFLSKKESAQEAKADVLLTEACKQILSRHYGEQNVRGKELFRAGVVFSEAKRQFVGWRLV